MLDVLFPNNIFKDSILLCGNFNIDIMVDDSHKSASVSFLLNYNLLFSLLEVTRPSSSNINGTIVFIILSSQFI